MIHRLVSLYQSDIGAKLASPLYALLGGFRRASVVALRELSIACELVAAGRVRLHHTAAWGEVELVVFQRNYAAQRADGKDRVIMTNRAYQLIR